MSPRKKPPFAITHDQFFKKNLSHLDTARDFFALCLPPDLYHRLNWEQLFLGKNENVNDRNDEIITDMLFKVAVEEVSCHLSLLVEHKSEGAMKKQEHTLPFLLRRNEVRVMEDTRRRDPTKPYPVIHLVGVYHGGQPYQGPLSVADHMNAPADLIPNRWRESMHLIDLAAQDDNLLLKQGRLGLVLMALKHIYDRQLDLTLPKLVPLMKQMDAMNGNAEFVDTFFQYLFFKAKLENKKVLQSFAVQSLREESEERVMTLAEKIFAEGYAQGEEERQKLKATLKKSEEDRRRSEEGRLRAEEERRLADEKRLRAEEERLCAEEERRHAKAETKQVNDARIKGLMSMLEKGFSLEDAASFTGFDLEEAKRLINQFRPKPP